MIMKTLAGYPEEIKRALHDSDFDIRVVTSRHRDTYSMQVRGNITHTDRAFAFAALLEAERTDDALDILELTRNMLLGRAWLQQEGGRCD